MLFAPNDSASDTTTSGAAKELVFDMVPQRQYQVTAKDADMWIRIVKTGGAAASVKGSGSHFVAKGATLPVALIGADRSRISFIRDGATDVTCCLSEIVPVVWSSPPL